MALDFANKLKKLEKLKKRNTIEPMKINHQEIIMKELIDGT